MSRPTRKKAKSLFYRLEKDPKDTVRQTTSKNLHLVELPNGECVEVKARDMNMGVETWDTISAISAEFKDALEDTIAKDPKYRRFFNALYIEVRGGKRVPKLYMNLLHAFGGELGIIPNDASLPHVERLLRSKDFEITSTERTNLVDTTCTFMNQEENLITPPGVVPWYQPKTMLPREVNILRLAEKSHLLKRMYSRFAGDSGNNGELHDAFYEFRNVTRRLNRATTPQRKVSPEMQPLPSDPKTTTKNPGKRKENVAQEIVEEAIKKVQPKIGQYQKSDRVVWTGSTPPKGATVIKYQRSKVSTDSKPTNLQTIYQDRELLHIILSEALHQYINSRHDPRNLLPSSVTATQRRDTNLFCGSMLSLIEARYERLKDHIITKHLERVHSAASQDEDRKFLSDFYQWLEDLTPEVYESVKTWEVDDQLSELTNHTIEFGTIEHAIEVHSSLSRALPRLFWGLLEAISAEDEQKEKKIRSNLSREYGLNTRVIPRIVDHYHLEAQDEYILYNHGHAIQNREHYLRARRANLVVVNPDDKPPEFFTGHQVRDILKKYDLEALFPIIPEHNFAQLPPEQIEWCNNLSISQKNGETKIHFKDPLRFLSGFPLILLGMHYPSEPESNYQIAQPNNDGSGKVVKLSRTKFNQRFKKSQFADALYEK